MQESAFVHPCVACVVLVCAATIARRLADLPFVSAELQHVRRRYRVRAAALRRGDSDDRSAGCWRRLVVGVDQQGGVLSAEVGDVLPAGVRTDVRERLSDEWLHPPDTAPGEHHNALTWPRAADPSLNRRHLFRAAFRRLRYFDER